jgi:hypothetical protein
LAKFVFVASSLVGCRFWLFSVLASSVFLPLLKNKLCVKVRHVGGGSGFHQQVLLKASQQSVQWICGILRDLQAFFWLWVFPAPKQNPRPPAIH